MRPPIDAVGAAAALCVLLVLVVLDVLTPGETIVLSPLFALSPVVAAAVLPASTTAGFALAAVVTAAVSGFWNHNADSLQHLVRVVDVALISAAAVAVAALRVHREQQVTHLTRLAEVAQRAVLPVLPAHARRVDIAARYQSAARDAVIGGDLYDCYHSRDHTRFLLGDVRGKGIEAIEQAARVIRAFRQAAAVHTSLAEAADDMDGYLASFFDEEEFVTAVLLDTTDAARPVLVSAGHPPPLLVHPDGSCELVEVPADLPLGLGLGFSQHAFSWQPGDRLLLYTDGLSEARDDDGEFLDLRVLGPLLCAGDVETAIDRVLTRVAAHATDGEVNDDIAMMLLEHSSTGPEYLPQQTQHDWAASLSR